MMMMKMSKTINYEINWKVVSIENHRLSLISIVQHESVRVVATKPIR